MKKTILTALAAMLLAVPAAQAQKVNKEALLSKIEKSDEAVADAKKGTKSATWINRGKAYYDAAVAPTKSLFVGLEGTMLKLADGDPTSVGKETVNGTEYEAWVYPYYTAYFEGGKVKTWKQTQTVYDGAIDKALESYVKAYEMDPKSASKVKDGLQQISDFCSQVGNAGLDTGDFVGAADAYIKAFTAQSCPAYEGKPDPALLYYAGYLRTVDGANNPESFVLGGEYLSKAIDMGYADEEGNIYYYLFHCYYGQKDKDRSFLEKAKQMLLSGVEKFPKNDRIIDGLVQLYTTPDDKVGDPADLIDLIDKAIENNPSSVDLWFGRGRIFYALKDYDQSIASFKKVVELMPDLYEGNYYLGVFYTIKGDEANKAINEKQYSSQAAYDADLKDVNAIYMEAVPYLEKALEIKANDPSTLELLKSICFRLRDEAGMMEKYNKYNELFKQVQGQE